MFLPELCSRFACSYSCRFPLCFKLGKQTTIILKTGNNSFSHIISLDMLINLPNKA